MPFHMFLMKNNIRHIFFDSLHLILVLLPMQLAQDNKIPCHPPYHSIWQKMECPVWMNMPSLSPANYSLNPFYIRNIQDEKRSILFVWKFLIAVKVFLQQSQLHQ